jgi:hypothetical protein
MGETEWKHAGWVSGLGKWAWIILLLLGIGRILVEIGSLLTVITAYETARVAWILAFGPPYPVAFPIGSLGGVIWGLIGGILTLIVALFIIRPKFSKPCGEKDWETLYGWTLGGTKLPWMLIWGIIFVIFGWFYITGIFVLLPAIMLIWVGPRKYEW